MTQEKDKQKKKILTIHRFDIELDEYGEYQLSNKIKKDNKTNNPSNKNRTGIFKIFPTKKFNIKTIIFPKPVFVVKSKMTENKVALLRSEKVQQFMNKKNLIIKSNGQNLNNYRIDLEKKKNKNSFLFTFWNLFAMKINIRNLKNCFSINLKLARIIVL